MPAKKAAILLGRDNSISGSLPLWRANAAGKCSRHTPCAVYAWLDERAANDLLPHYGDRRKRRFQLCLLGTFFKPVASKQLDIVLLRNLPTNGAKLPAGAPRHENSLVIQSFHLQLRSFRRMGNVGGRFERRRSPSAGGPTKTISRETTRTPTTCTANWPWIPMTNRAWPATI